MELTYDNIKKVMKSKGYLFFEGNLNINRIGIRTSKKATNNFDDYFVLLWEEDGKQNIYIDKNFTTDPGLYYLQKELLNPKGCAILAPGQYKGMHIIGLHRGQYEAFVQNKPCKVYRDRNLDNVLDCDPTTEIIGVYGINQHHGYDSLLVNKNSAGCQVHRYKKDLAFVLKVAKKSAKIYGRSFTYTLLEEKDF